MGHNQNSERQKLQTPGTGLWLSHCWSEQLKEHTLSKQGFFKKMVKIFLGNTREASQT